jgi:hypothetical protein
MNMFSTIFGLPAAVVVLVPLAALSALVVAVWPAARARYAPLVLGLATLALISIPLATQTGEKLESHVQPSAFVERHTEMADGPAGRARGPRGAAVPAVRVPLTLPRPGEGHPHNGGEGGAARFPVRG